LIALPGQAYMIVRLRKRDLSRRVAEAYSEKSEKPAR
jgi:hypothetical protein